jgi:anti-sigma28 factor (negative regulator of flagellin synthesis)
MAIYLGFSWLRPIEKADTMVQPERSANAMRRTGHEPTQHAHDLPRVQYAALPYRSDASTHITDTNEGGASEQRVCWLQTRAYHRARAVVQTAPEVRVAQVEAARRALQEGTLTLNGHALAETLLQAARTDCRHA